MGATDIQTQNSMYGSNNQAPVADIATLAVSYPEGSSVSFDGSASADPDDAVVTYAWTAAWTLVFLLGSGYFLTRRVVDGDWSRFDGTWIRYWHVYLWIQVAVSLVVVVWFTWGGLRDVRAMFARLKSMDRDDADDGMVRRRLARTPSGEGAP